VSDPVTLTATSENQIRIGLPSALPPTTRQRAR